MVVSLLAVLKSTDNNHDRVLQEFSKLAKWVEENEPDVLMYKASKNPKAANEIIVMERYATQKAFDEHGSSSEFLKLMKLLKEENLGELAEVRVYEELDIGFIRK